MNEPTPPITVTARSPGDDPLTDFQARTVCLEETSRRVYVSGSGPGVIVLSEMPGISPHVARFARWVRRAGFTVYLPSLFGRDGAVPQVEEGLAVIRRNIRVYFERTDRTWTTTRALLVMMTEGFMEGSAMRGDLAEYNRAALAALEKHIRIGIAAGEVRADVDPVTMPVILLGAMRGVMLQWLLDGDIDLLRVRDRMLELVDRTLAR